MTRRTKRVVTHGFIGAIALGAAVGCPNRDGATLGPIGDAAGSSPSGTAIAAHTSGYRTRPVDGRSAAQPGQTENDGKAVLVRVIFEGRPRSGPWAIPPMVRSQCQGAVAVPNDALVVAADGGVSDVVVWIDDIHEGAELSPGAATQDEKGCVFAPHVLAVPSVGTLHLSNSDPANHALRFEFSPSNDARDDFTKTLPAGGTMAIPVSADWAGTYAKVTCPIHLWMWSYVHFFEHPYFAVTRAGAARIANVPPGRYHVTAWHEGIDATFASAVKLGQPVTARAEVVIAGADVNVVFALSESGALRVK